MKTRFILVRHGQSTGNLTSRFLGHHDGKLTPLGMEQAKRAAAYLQDTPIDIAYASDLSRAYETGRIIAAPHNLIPIPDCNLREIFAGEWENRPFTEIAATYPEDYATWMNDIDHARPTGGESVAELGRRIEKELWRLASIHSGQTVLIGIHATPLRTLIASWYGQSVASVKWVSNASTTFVDYDTDTHTVTPIECGIHAYLADMNTNLPANV